MQKKSRFKKAPQLKAKLHHHRVNIWLGMSSCQKTNVVGSAGCSWSCVCRGDDRAAEPTQALLWEELAHSGLRCPKWNGPPRGPGLALKTAGGCRSPGRSLRVTSLCITVFWSYIFPDDLTYHGSVWDPCSSPVFSPHEALNSQMSRCPDCCLSSRPSLLNVSLYLHRCDEHGGWSKKTK